MIKYLLALLIVVALGGGLYWYGAIVASHTEPASVSDYKNATYEIDGKSVTLVNGRAETETVPNSASKTVTQYFGNEARGDLNGDGLLDIAFLLTQSGGGSGTFYYVVAALMGIDSYKGTNAVLLGDRIAPQTTETKDGQVIINYADRKPTEPMTAPPSIGVSKYLKVENGKLLEIAGPQPAPSPSGKSGIKGNVLLGPICPVMRDPPDPQCADKPYAASLVLTTPDGVRVVKTFSSDDAGEFNVEVPPGGYVIRSAAASNIRPCSSRESVVVQAGTYTQTIVYCDTGIR